MPARPLHIASYTIAGLGVLALMLNFVLGDRLNLSLPLALFTLGGGVLLLIHPARQKWRWASFLYIPAALLLTLGAILLLNTLTNDWNAWAFAWLLLVAGSGVGLLLAERELSLSAPFKLAGWGMTAAGLALFILFGAIAGGTFINVAAPLLIILAGLSLRWVKPERILPAPLLKRLRLTAPDASPTSGTPFESGLIEPLSSREMDVLRLVQGGYSNQQIAAQLHIAPSTVKTHINNIYGKLGAQTRVQAINRARELGLLDS
ncbi:MAG: response regulator transcription factor [Chloroflexota bacterium]|jgi:DNA-binding CsgD family transcriptional regulator